MSAYEVVGVVLAVLPMVIDGLDAYSNSPAAKLARAKEERRQFLVDLMAIQSGVRFAIQRLLVHVDARLTPDQWRTFRAHDAKGSIFFDLWKDILQENPSITESNTMREIKFVLEEIAVLLTQVVENTDIPHNAGSKVLMTVIENDRMKRGMLSIAKDLSTRFKIVRGSSKRRKLIQRVRAHIEWLEKLNSEEETWKATTLPRYIRETHNRHGAFLHTVRDYCEDLYDALSNVWHCDCHKACCAMLKLENRKSPEGNRKEYVRFSLFLTFEHSSTATNLNEEHWDFQEAQIYHIHQR
jgi:hypothetical protein